MVLNKNIDIGSFDYLVNNFDGTKKLVLSSYGGSLIEGWAMYDYLVDMDKKEVEVIGMCASAATIPLLAFERRVGTKNSRYLIHNPWTIAVGDSAVFDSLSKEMTREEGILVDLYEQNLNISRDEIILLMKQEKELTAEEALYINLITEIKNMMTEEQINEKLANMENSLFAKIKNFFKPQKKAMTIQMQDGTELNFGEEVETEEQIVVGVKATADGQPANGEYMRPNGDVLTFEGGELTLITKAEIPADPEIAIAKQQEELESIKAVNAELQAQLNTVIEAKETMTKNLAGLQNRLDKLSSKHNPGINVPSQISVSKNRVGNKNNNPLKS